MGCPFACFDIKHLKSCRVCSRIGRSDQLGEMVALTIVNFFLGQPPLLFDVVFKYFCFNLWMVTWLTLHYQAILRTDCSFIKNFKIFFFFCTWSHLLLDNLIITYQLKNSRVNAHIMREYNCNFFIPFNLCCPQ